MRAVVLESHGGPEVLTIRDVPEPTVGPEEVLVDVAATALNRADVLQRMGLYPGPKMDHEIPGLEFSGTVADLGARVTTWRTGDQVMGIVGGGAYAERIAVHERQVLAVPATVDLHVAAAIPEVWITAWDALVLQGGLTSGRTALVHAGASGVGTAAIQLCKAVNARVIVTASAGKLDACRELGADLSVDYAADDFVERSRVFTDDRGVDVVLDVIGGDYVDRNVDALAVGGRIVQVGVMGGGGGGVNVGKLLPKRASIIGTVLRARPLEEKIAVTQRFAREVLPLFDEGVLRPVIDRHYPFDEIGSAHERMQANANIGKLVVDVRT
jgi:putative PIG3 family NAD(P)H quinone oxidoreductase